MMIRGWNACTNFPSVDGRELRPQTKDSGTEAVSARSDAGAALQVQPGLRGLRKNSISGSRAEAGALSGRMLQSGGRVRRADGVHSRRRTADALADRKDRRKSGGAQGAHLSLHECPAAERKAAPLQAQQIPDVFRSH